jgi:hippurate hydrolase
MLEEGLLKKFPFDEIYGFHNWPFLPRGVFAIRSGPMLAAVDEFEIRLQGQGGHAAMPHSTRDVVPVAAHLVLALQSLVSRETNPTDAAVISVTNVRAGLGSFNVISGSAELTGTVRTFDQSLRDRIEARISEVSQSIAKAFRASCAVTYKRLIDPVSNDEVCTDHGRDAAAAVAGSANVVDFKPMMGGEDFGGFLQVKPGAFIALGQAEAQEGSPYSFGLHSPEYDFNDEIIPIAVRYFARLAESRMPLD